MNTTKSTQITGTTVRDFDWESNNMRMQGLSCPKHLGCRWLTKHAWDRSVFYVSELTPQCDCPLGDLIVE